TQATAIEAQLKADEAQALRWLEQDSLWLKIARAPFASPTAPALPKNFSFSVFRDQSPVFWTDQHVFFPDPPHNPLAIAYPGRAPYYFIHRQVSKDFSVTAAVPLPGIVAAASPSTDYPIQNNSGQIVGNIQEWNPVPLPSFWQKLHLLAALLLSISTFFLADKSARTIASKTGALPAIIGIIGLAATWLFAVGTLSYPSLELVQALIQTDLPYGNLAQLTVAPLILFWLLSLGQRLPLSITKQPRPYTYHLLLSTLGFGSIIAALLVGGRLFRSLLLETNLNFDFSNVLTLGKPELVALSAIVMLMLTLLLASLWTVKSIHQLSLTRNQRLISIGAAMLLATPLILLIDLDLGLLPMLLLPVLYIALLDLFVEIEAASPAWLMLWLALLSAFAAGLLFKYNLDKGHDRRLALAKALADPNDSKAEMALIELKIQLTEEPPRDSLANILLNTPYLYKNYNWRILPFRQIRQLTRESFAFRLSPNANYYTHYLEWKTDSAIVFQPALQSNRRVLQELVPTAPHQQTRY
ncbi:MAG: hypothetical protein HRU12_04965, partial [Phaeodactylibacter sp.]|nr:hypothetical protein [Phaeodactylibacter sp.]